MRYRMTEFYIATWQRFTFFPGYWKIAKSSNHAAGIGFHWLWFWVEFEDVPWMHEREP